MIVVQALWCSASRLAVWAEDPRRPPVAPPRRGRPPSRPKPRPHPFACEHVELADALAHLGVPSDGAARPELGLLLPSAKDAPQPSPGVLRDVYTDVGSVTALAPWTVPALALSPSDSMKLLLALPHDPSGVLIGDSVRFFAEVAKLALELVVRGRVVPALEQRGQGWAACWRPAPAAGADVSRLDLLASAMPAVCRAEFPHWSWDGREPRGLLHDAVGVLVDASVRASLPSGALIGSRRKRRAPEPVARVAWRTALAADDPWVESDPYDLELLQKTLDDWAYPVDEANARPFRTCFRLSEPDDRDGTASWRLDILLQASDDPSLLVPSERVWEAADSLKMLDRTLEDPQELLLADLGRALRLCSGLEAALDGPTPTGIELSNKDAHAFLTDNAGALKEAGFGVLIPPWWGSRTSALGVKLRVAYKDEGAVAGASLLGVDGLLNYRWRVAIGDHELSLRELRMVAALKSPLVKVRGRWVELQPADLEAALALFKEKAAPGEMTIADAMRAGLGLDASPMGLPVVAVEADGKLKELFAADGETQVRSVKTPQGFEGKLRPYQQRGLGWLAFLGQLGLGACLADDMGLGKTAQLLALLVEERNGERRRPNPSLVVCPMSVVSNWERESLRFTPELKVHVHHGPERLKGRAFARVVKSSDLVVTTYALVARDKEQLMEVMWGRVVLDEAQNIKTSAAKQTQAVRALEAEARVALTGTPVENRLSELWSIMEFLNPGLLGPAKVFKERFALPIERYRNEDAAARLKRMIGPFILRRLKTDRVIIKDLPDKIEIKVFCNLTREQASLYQAVVDDMMEKIDSAEGMSRKGLVLATIMKLKQITNHPAQFLKDGSELPRRSGKLVRLEEILEEILAERDKALCFTQFAELGHILKPYLQERFGREVAFLHGGVPKKGRDDIVTRFQRDSDPALLLVSLKAGGTGLNLTAATNVIHFDRWWNPAVEDQATDRAFRIGQKRNVQVRKFVCQGTLEERIDTMIERKKELAHLIVGSGESWLTELSTADLKEIVALSTDAVRGD